MLLQTCRLDNQSAPMDLLIRLEHLVTVVLGDLPPVRSVLLPRELDPVEAVLALHESDGDGSDAVRSVAVRADEGSLREF